MGVTADDRVRGALLAGLALAALAVGGWWWRQAVPATGPVPAALASAPATPAPPAPESALGVVIDESDGQIIGSTEADPDEPVVIHQESGAPQETMIPHVVWQDRSHLEAGQDPLVRQTTPSPGARYLLMAGCTGPGKLSVTFSGSSGDGPGQPVTCSGPPLIVTLVASGGPLAVRFAVTDGEVDLDARLSALS